MLSSFSKSSLIKLKGGKYSGGSRLFHYSLSNTIFYQFVCGELRKLSLFFPMARVIFLLKKQVTITSCFFLFPVFCCLLQMLQYLTTAFMIIEIILVVHAIAMVCKLNYENPINTYRLKTYNEYKTVKDSLRNQQMNQINDVQPPTNINPAARMSFDLNPRGGDDSISYSFPG